MNRRKNEMATPLEKGDQLEAAVELIERAILKSAPTYAEDSMLIEPKKFVSVSGVRHEINIFVTVRVASGYEAIFIFECKNWANPVKKNEIIIFSEKIEAVQAQKGFFVAREFSKDAVAQSGKDQRVTLLRFSDNFVLPEFVEAFHVVLKNHKHSDITFMKKRDDKDVDIGKKMPVAESANCILNGEHIDLKKLANQLAERASGAKLNTENTTVFGDQTYSLTTQEEFECNEDYRLVINDVEIEKCVVTVEFEVKIVRSPIISKFIVEKRGRLHVFAPVTLAKGGWFQISFVEPSSFPGKMCQFGGIS
jgi:hypothetical protein